MADDDKDDDDGHDLQGLGDLGPNPCLAIVAVVKPQTSHIP